MDDASIMKMLTERNEEAITELKQKYSRLCFYIAGNILSQPEDVEECVNSAFFAIWKNIPPDTPDDLKTYLCRIVKNKAVDKLKYNSAEKRNPQFSVSLDEIADCIPDDRGENISTEKAFLVGEEEESFFADEGEVEVKTNIFEDDDAKEEYSMNEKTVATTLYRIRMKLKEYLEKEGYYV